MYTVSFTKSYIGLLLFNTGGWVYFGYLIYYASFLDADTCNSYTKDFTDVAKIFLGIGMSATSLNIIGMTIDATNDTNRHIHERGYISVDNLCCMFVSTIASLSVSGIFALAVFGVTSGMSDIQCSDANAEFALKLLVYGLCWIAFVEMCVIVVSMILFLKNIIGYVKVCEPCFDICKKYRERRIVCSANVGLESSMKKYNTHHVTIPMPIATATAAQKEEHNLLCSICYDASITLLLEPCNHICMCNACYNSLVKKECPVCKTEISATKKVYFATPGR
jgi:hypothetical protein